MIDYLDYSFVLFFLDNVFLQGDDGGIFSFMNQNRQALGSDDPIVEGVILTLFGVTGFGIVLNLFNSLVRKKLVDQTKLKRIMTETKAWQKERMSATRAKDQAKIAELSKKSSHMNKMSMEMMQMNMKPMMITFVPLILIFYLVLPQLFAYTVALFPIPLNVLPGNFFQLTCTAEPALEEGHVCFGHENALYLWAWYFLSSISFSGIIMKLTKTSMDLS